MNLTMVLSPEEMDILIMYILIKFIRENQPALVSFAASEVGTGKGFAYQEFLDQLGRLSAPSCCFSSAWFKGPAIFFLHTGFGIAWFLGSWLLGVLYDIDVLYLTAVSVGAQLLAIVFYLLCIRKAAQED